VIESLSWLGLATLVVVIPACVHPVLANALYLVLHRQTAVQLERERRVTLIDVLGRLRPGFWIVEHSETGYRRSVGQIPWRQAAPEQLATDLVDVGDVQ
jgi:hypothetical protein